MSTRQENTSTVRQRRPPPPVASAIDAAHLRADLIDAGFTAAHLADLAGPVAAAALDREQRLPMLRLARGDDGAAAILMRLFALGDVVTRVELDRALPKARADGAAHLGLVRAAGHDSDDAVRAVIDLQPLDVGGRDLWLTSDLPEAVTGRPVRPDHVLGFGAAARTLADILIRESFGRSLDLGTGCGIHAITLAGCAEVVATDISPRALAFAAFNAALNEVSLDLRAGDLLEPVRDERFDLVVSNPPFVITPRTGAPAMTYRDGGLSGDDLIAGLIRALPSHLAPGGVAQFLANWEIPTGAHWTQRLEQWTADLDVDVWVIQRDLADPARYAETWLRDGGLSPERDRDAWERGYADYLIDFARRDVEGIGFGYVMLRRPERARVPWRRMEELSGTLPPGAGQAIARTLSAVDRQLPSGAPPDGTARLAGTYVVAQDVTEERHHMPGEPDPRVIHLRQGGGLGRSVQVSSHAAALVGACDGELTLEQIVAALAHLSGEPVGRIGAALAGEVRELILDGFLQSA